MESSTKVSKKMEIDLNNEGGGIDGGGQGGSGEDGR